jgi:hypothetical protein
LWFSVDEVIHNSDVVGSTVIRPESRGSVSDPDSRNHWLIEHDAEKRGENRRSSLKALKLVA